MAICIQRTLEREVRGCQKLIIWTDCDREGENIGFEVIQVCLAIKPNIPVLRARFSEITQRYVLSWSGSSVVMHLCYGYVFHKMFEVSVL